MPEKTAAQKLLIKEGYNEDWAALRLKLVE